MIVDPRNAIPNHLGRWTLVLLVVRIIGTVSVHGMTLYQSLDLPVGRGRSQARRQAKRVGGVGVKISNPDRPDALISDQISKFRLFSSSVRSTLRNVSSPAQRFTLLVTLLSGR